MSIISLKDKWSLLEQGSAIFSFKQWRRLGRGRRRIKPSILFDAFPVNSCSTDATLDTTCDAYITPKCSPVRAPMSVLPVQIYACTVEAIENQFRLGRTTSVDTLVVPPEQLFVDVHSIDTFLSELKCSKENGINHARARHRNTETCKGSAEYGEMPVSLKTHLDTSEG